jgi:hypothetical protein
MRNLFTLTVFTQTRRPAVNWTLWTSLYAMTQCLRCWSVEWHFTPTKHTQTHTCLHAYTYSTHAHNTHAHNTHNTHTRIQTHKHMPREYVRRSQCEHNHLLVFLQLGCIIAMSFFPTTKVKIKGKYPWCIVPLNVCVLNSLWCCVVSVWDWLTILPLSHNHHTQGGEFELYQQQKYFWWVISSPCRVRFLWLDARVRFLMTWCQVCVLPATPPTGPWIPASKV